MPRGVEEDFDDAGAGPDPPAYMSNARSPVRRNHTDDEDDEAEVRRPSRKSAMKKSGGGGRSGRGVGQDSDDAAEEELPRGGRGGPSGARGGRRAHESEDDERPRGGGRSAGAGVRGGRRTYESEDDEPPRGGSKAGSSRALTTRNKGNWRVDDEETIQVARFSRMPVDRLSNYDLEGLIEVFNVTAHRVESWCANQKITWDVVKDRPNFKKIVEMFPEKKAQWEDWQESELFYAQREAEAEEEARFQAMRVAERTHSREMEMRMRMRIRAQNLMFPGYYVVYH